MDTKEMKSIIFLLQDLLDDLDRGLLDCERDAIRGAIAILKDIKSGKEQL